MPNKTLSQLGLEVANMAAEPNDSQGLRLRKSLLIGANIIFPLVVSVWLITFIVYDEPLAAAAPAFYIIISYSLLATFLLTRRYQLIVHSQQIMILLLPFVVMFALGGLLDPLIPDSQNLPPAIILIFFILNIGVVSAVAFIPLYHFVYARDKTLKLLRSEQARSDRLLLNVLPKEIAIILKDEGGTVAERFDHASILFADLVGFTPLWAEMPPEYTVELLNEIFSHFDTLVDGYGLEKIRTIGDNYMVASGVPRPRADHAPALADLALEMSQCINKRPATNGHIINFRIGINSGMVVGAVIGRSKFHYDVWGDAVNIASRMESHGQPGRIQISAETCEYLKEDYICEPRGMIEVKGKGEMKTWFLVGRKEPGLSVPVNASA